MTERHLNQTVRAEPMPVPTGLLGISHPRIPTDLKVEPPQGFSDLRQPTKAETPLCRIWSWLVEYRL